MKIFKDNKSSLLIFVCWLAYTVSYVGRLSYTANIANLTVNETISGQVTSAFFFCYGIGQLINGLLCDKVNSKYAIVLSLFVSVAITVTMFFLNNFTVMSILWGLNGLSLSVLWSNLIKCLSLGLNKKKMNSAVIAMATTVPIGTLVIYGMSSLFSYVGFWKLSYFVSALFMAVGAIVFLCCYRSGDVAVEEESLGGENLAVGSQAQTTQRSVFKALSFMCIPLFLSAILVNFEKDGITTWLPNYLKDTFSLTPSFSILLTLLLPLFSIISAYISLKLVEKFKNEFIVCAFFFFATAVLLLLVIILKTFLIFALVLFVLCSISMHAVNNILTSILPLKLKNKVSSGRLAGITNAFCYLGSTFGIMLLGVIKNNASWNTCMIVLMFVSLFAAIVNLIGSVRART